ncbi:MAG: UvrD-helicase domain-containing protein [Spirochaetota bacterium]|nr:UvrD-helicase domain-containing protein [Spirochaetota bacterium]
MPLTFEDPSIVFNVNQGMILEASAGSGKTTILTERWLSSFLYLIVWEQKTVSEALQSITALTFTKKAAIEMKNRIRERIEELWQDNELEYILNKLTQFVGEYPTSLAQITSHLESQRNQIDDLLSSAKVMTINSYVLQLLRAHPLELNIDIGLTPEEGSYDISSTEQEAQLNLLRKLLLQEYPKHQAIFQFGVHLLGLNKWVSLLEQIRKLVFQYGDRAIKEGLDNSVYFLYEKEMLEVITKEDTLNRVFAIISPSINALIETLNIENNHKTLTKGNTKLYKSLKNINKDNLLNLFSKDLLGVYDESNPVKDEVLNELRKNSYYAYQSFIDGLYRIIIPLMMPISDLCTQELKKTQAEYGEISFGDSEIMLLDALKNKTFLDKITRHTRFFFADEYQDTSDLQKEIFDSIIADDTIIPFFVGDPKQSIYSFRRANVYVFANTVSEFISCNYEHKLLNTNYRSSKSHVDLVNYLFTDIFHNDHAGIKYQNQLSKKEDEGSFAYTLALGIEDDEESKSLTKDKLDKAYHEALFMVNDLILQKVNPGDIMILFRNKASILDFYRLSKEYYPQLPLSSSVRNILWDNSYITPILSFLKTLLNPHHNLTMIELLKTPIFRKTDIEINELLIKAQENDKSLFEILEGHEYNILKEFIILRDRISLEELISLLIKELYYEEYLDLISETGDAKATLSLFIDEAQKLQEKREMSLGDFIKYIDQKKTTTEEAEFSGEEGETLRLMTVHSSKGLESPYVIYIHKANVNEKNVRYPIYQKNQIAFDILGKGIIAENLSKEKLKEETAEEKRLAYVAITRAKKNFVFCALPTIRKDNKTESKLFETQWASFINKELIEKNQAYASRKLKLNITIEKQQKNTISEDTSLYNQRYEWLLKKDNAFIRQELPQFLSVSLLLDAEFNPDKFYDKYIRHSFNLLDSLRELGEEEFTLYTPSQQDIGSLVHLLLQEFNNPTRQEVLEYLQVYHHEKKEVFNLAISYAYGYWESEFYQGLLTNSSATDKERQVLYLLPNEIMMRATADLYVSSRDNKHTIVDYKLSVGKNKDRYHRQLSYYALLSEKAHQQVDNIVLFSLKEAKEYYLIWDREETEQYFNKAVQVAMNFLTNNEIQINNLKPSIDWEEKSTLF